MRPTDKSLIPYYKKIDLSEREEFRVYVFPSGDTVRIDSPQFLIISDNGHRIGCKDISHYVPYGWIDLWWKNQEEQQDNFYCENPKEAAKVEFVCTRCGLEIIIFKERILHLPRAKCQNCKSMTMIPK